MNDLHVSLVLGAVAVFNGYVSLKETNNFLAALSFIVYLVGTLLCMVYWRAYWEKEKE